MKTKIIEVCAKAKSVEKFLNDLSPFSPVLHMKISTATIASNWDIVIFSPIFLIPIGKVIKKCEL